MVNNEITCIEILTSEGRKHILDFYDQNPEFLDLNPDAPYAQLVKNKETIPPLEDKRGPIQ